MRAVRRSRLWSHIEESIGIRLFLPHHPAQPWSLSCPTDQAMSDKVKGRTIAITTGDLVYLRIFSPEHPNSGKEKMVGHNAEYTHRVCMYIASLLPNDGSIHTPDLD